MFAMVHLLYGHPALLARIVAFDKMACCDDFANERGSKGAFDNPVWIGFFKGSMGFA
jgi:hypothetical protein